MSYLKAYKFIAVFWDCADLHFSDVLIYFKRYPYNSVYLVAFQIVERNRQIPVVEEFDVTHDVSCPTEFSGSVAMLRDIVVLLCKLFLTQITTSRLVKLHLFLSCVFPYYCSLNLLDAFVSQFIKA